MQVEVTKQSALNKFKSIFISASNVPSDILLEIMESVNNPIHEENSIEPIEVFEGRLSLFDLVTE